MAADGSIIIDTRVNTDGFNALSGSIPGLTRSLKKIGAAIGAAFAVRSITQFAKEAIALGSDLQEVQNVVDVTFGKLSGLIDEFASTAIEQFGLSELAAKQFTSTLGAMFKSMGFGTSQAAKMSMELAGLAGDMASFYNLDPNEAFSKIRAGISGETEPLKQLGINLSVANLEAFALAQGIGKAYSAMSQQEQALLRYNYLLSVTSDAQGDFARTSNTWANQTRVLTERFKALKATIGQGLINVLTPVIKVINTILAGLQVLANAFKQVTALLFGDASGGGSSGSAGKTAGAIADGYEEAADSAGDLADKTEDAEKAAKRYIAGFDEITKLGEQETEVPGMENVETAIPEVEFEGIDTDFDVEDKISPKIEALVNKIKELLEPLKKIDFGPLRESLSKLGDAFQKLGGTIGKALELAWYNILVPFATWTIEEASPAAVNLLAEAFEFLNQVLEGLQPLGEWLWDNFLSKLAKWSGDLIVNALNGLADGLDRISEWISTHQEAVNNLLTLILSIVGSLGALAGISKILEYVGAVAALAPEVGLLTAMFPKLSSAISSVVGLITGTIIPSITSVFGAIASALGISVGWVVAIGVAIGVAVAGMIIYWDEIKAFFQMTLPKILDQFKVWLSKKLEEISGFFSNLGTKIAETFVKAKERIFEELEKAYKYIEESFIQPVQDWFHDLKESITNAISIACQKIRSTFENTCKRIESDFVVPLKDVINQAGKWISDNFNGTKEKIMEMWKSLPQWFSQNITGPIADFFNKLTDGVIDAFYKTVDSVNSAIEDLIDNFNRIVSTLSSGFSRVFSSSSSKKTSTTSSRDNSAYWSSMSAYSVTPDVPHLARGSVIPPNHEFMAVLGDQKSGTNVEAPLATIQEAVAMVMEDVVQGQMIGFESIVVLLQQILEAVLGIEIDGETISNAVKAYNQKMAIVRGG